MIRNKNDVYNTPEWCYKLLESFIDWDKVFSALEPCEGDGRITSWIQSHIEDTVETFEINNGKDYFKTTLLPHSKDLLVTNPPYYLAFEFVKKGVKESWCSFWLLRLAFLSSLRRKQFFLDNPLSALIVLSKRPSFRLTGDTDSSDYAWFVWDKMDVCKVRGVKHV